MSRKYEISVWNDIYDEELGRYKEEKLIIIGSDTMTSLARARSPQMVSNVDGTNTFTFTLYYSYIDPETGERIKNPYVNYLVNERKVKVFWKDKWYDLLVKNIKENNHDHTFTYTCKDQYLTELSRTGFDLEFNTELENNIGTAPELVNKVLDGTDWRLAANNDTIYQTMEEPVYEVRVLNSFECKVNPSGESITIQEGLPILVYYSCAPDKDNLKTFVQFYYSGSESFQQDENDMLVINGDCCGIDVKWDVDNETATAISGGNELFTISFAVGLSKQFRAARYVRSQKTVYNSILGRYVNVYNNGNLLGYQTTEYSDANAVVNLITNPSNFSNTSGWIGEGLVFALAPTFDKNTDITKYEASSYLKFPSNQVHIYNSGIQNNRSYIPNGFIEGERYIFRIKATSGESAGGEEVSSTGVFTPLIYQREPGEFAPTGESYFSLVNSEVGYKDKWLEYPLQCVKSCSYADLISTLHPFGIFIQKNDSTGTYWLKEVQFFKEAFGEDSEGTEIRIEPGRMDIQSVAQVVWKYFNADQPEGTTADTLEYTHTSLGEWSDAVPVYNNFEKYGTIEESNSNRFNILQTIAETFQVWIKFIIEHDENGYVLYDENNLPQKYIQLVEEVGEEKGVNFIYGVDLKTITRQVDSSSIATKTIVSQNENEFGKNGFCSIARSEQNYPRENFIYNFDYFIQQGLLDGDALNNDLYNTSGLAYYTNLHNYNTEYAKNVDELINRKQELTRQSATATVYSQYISSATDELSNIESDIIKLASASSIEDAEGYVQTHSNYTKLTTLLDDRSITKNLIANYQDLSNKINSSIEALEKRISELNEAQTEIITNLLQLNKQFYAKYSRYIQEGTWSSEEYYDDDLYYLDALQVAYTSSRPKVTYTIDVLRLSDIDEYSSKVFQLGDICTIQDTEYFGYLADKITPYKEKIFISEITSYFDTPDKDTFKVQNYKTQFDDLFQRIAAATQNLEFSQGKYAKAANIVNSDGTIKSSVIQNTFDSNKDLVYGAQNESATFDNTGITVTNNEDGSKQVKVTSGGIFITSDGGTSWKNAIRGDGITADVLTAGKINTEQITIYNGDYPSFSWDATGLSAYKFNDNGSTDLETFVRFDQFGIYGIKNNGDFKATSINAIKSEASFGMTWDGFFLKSVNDEGSVEISSENDILIKAKDNKGNISNRIMMGRLPELVEGQSNYGLTIWDNDNNIVFKSDASGTEIAGWTITEDCLASSYVSGNNIQIRSDGNIGCYAHDALTIDEYTYPVTLRQNITATNIGNNNSITINSGSTIYIFSSYIGSRITTRVTDGNYNSSYDTNPQTTPDYKKWDTTIQFSYGGDTYSLGLTDWIYNTYNTTHETYSYENNASYTTLYTYSFDVVGRQNGTSIFTIGVDATANTQMKRLIPASETRWSISNTGVATFYDISARGGTIAGWRIDEEKIWSTKTGTILSSNGSAKSGSTDYSIITNAINAAMASLGGVIMSGGLINGYSLAKIYQTANNAYNRANSAYNLAAGINTSSIQTTANNANTNAQNALNQISRLQNQFQSHTHVVLTSSITITNVNLGTIKGETLTGTLRTNLTTDRPRY